MEFKTLPFTKEENLYKFRFDEFTERGYPMAILSIIDDNFFLNSKTNYKLNYKDFEVQIGHLCLHFCHVNLVSTWTLNQR